MESKGLTVKELLESIDLHCVQRGTEETKVVIGVDVGHATIGPLPTVEVTGVHMGFDWDSGKMFLRLASPVAITGDALEALKANHHKATECIAFVHMILRGKGTPEEKLEAIAGHFIKRKTKKVAE